MKVVTLSESGSVVSDSLRSHVLYSPWNSPGQNTGLGSLSPLQGDHPNPGIKPRSPALQVDSLSAEPQGKPKNSGVGSLSLSPGDLPNREIEPGSPALQADFLPAEVPGKPRIVALFLIFKEPPYCFASVYIPNNSVRGFPFPYTLSSIYCL